MTTLNTINSNFNDLLNKFYQFNVDLLKNIDVF